MEKEKNVIDLRRLWRAMKSLKWVYLAATILCGGAAIWYVTHSLTKTPIIGQILIGEDSMDPASGAASVPGAGSMNQLMKTFSVGGFSGAAVDNEVLVMGSHDVMVRTVKALNLNRSYIAKEPDGKKTMLYGNSPVTVEAPAEYFDTLSVSYTVKIHLLGNNKADITVKRGLIPRTLAKVENASLPTAVKTPYGTFQILRSPDYASSPYKEISVNVAGNQIAATRLNQDISVDVATKLSDVIQVDIEYPNVELGKNIVNVIMGQYNAKRLDRVHETSQKTIEYYDERLAASLEQLESAEQKVLDYQRKNNVVAPEPELKGLTGASQDQQIRIVAARNKLDYYSRISSTLRTDLNGDVLIPQQESFGDPSIHKYNELVLDRRELLHSATPDNSALISLNEQMASMRKVLLDNAEKVIAATQSELNASLTTAGSLDSRLQQYPSITLDMSILNRDRTFQTQLYQFLSQARENAILKYYTDADPGFIFQPAYAAKPGLPVKNILIVIGAIIFALTGVTFLALIILWCSHKVKAPMDLAFIGIDTHTVADTPADSPLAMAHLRTLLMADPSPRKIYCADLTEQQELVGRLTDTLTAAGAKITLVETDANAALCSPEINESACLATASPMAYAILPVPEPRKVFEVENLVDTDGAALVIAIPQGIKRATVKSILKGQTAEKVYALIVPIH